MTRTDYAERQDKCHREIPVWRAYGEPRRRRADGADIKAPGAVTLRAQRCRGFLAAQPEVSNPISIAVSDRKSVV